MLLGAPNGSNQEINTCIPQSEEINDCDQGLFGKDNNNN